MTACYADAVRVTIDGVDITDWPDVIGEHEMMDGEVFTGLMAIGIACAVLGLALGYLAGRRR